MAVAGFGYGAHDVAEALGRLSQVAAGRALSFPEGAGSLDPQVLQEQWAVAAQIDSRPEAVDHLKAVYNHIEAVILSCGAPDSFDVYEVCFEALTKIGFCLRGASSKELLFLLLEDVHEVYDVLLSCVETYEWVQPGATGQLRLWMLQVLFACFGNTSITGRDLMELTDNDVSGAVSLISFILRCEQAPFEMQSTAGRCLVELTTADSVFLMRQEGVDQDFQSQQIAKLTAMLNRHVNGLIKGIIQFEIVDAFGRCICQHQMSHTHTDIVVKHFLTTIHNCLLYCSENQKKLRQHLATQSTIVQDIMIPYVQNILPALYDNPACGPGLIEWQNLKAVMQTFAVVTFNINVFRPSLRDNDLLPEICRVPNLLTNVSMVELLIKIAINVDFTKGPYADLILTTLQNAFMMLTPEMQQRLQRRLTSGNSMRLPFARSSVKAVEVLAFALTPPGGEGGDPASLEERKARKKNQWRNAKNKQKKRKKMFAMQHSGKDGAAPEAPPEEEEEDSDDDDMPPLIPADHWESHLGAADEAGVPSGALCQLSGALMTDPVATPEGHIFERAALEDWTTYYATNPLTGMPLNMVDCRDAVEVQGFIQGYQLQSLSACQIAPEAFDEPQQPEVEAPPPAAQPVTGPSLLGDLPALLQQASAPQKPKKEKAKIRIESRSVVDCPEDMRCAVDGKVMVNPVRSPYGHYFERKTLERWMANCGSVCPMTQQPLRLEDCQPDGEMKKRIVKFLKGQQ